MTRYKIILNPRAGNGSGERAANQIEQLLRQYNLEFDIVHTTHPWHAVQLAKDAVVDKYHVIVAAGGDGTINEVINGLMLAKQCGYNQFAMGVLCVGRGNDFAHSIGIGFDAIGTIEANKLPRMGGFLSYFVAVLKTIFLYYKGPTVNLTFNNQTLTQPSLLVSIMNGRRLGGGFLMAPHAKPDDGLLDLCIADQVSRTRIFTLIPHFLRGTQATQPEIKTGQTAQITITAVEGTLPAQTDGEIISIDEKQLSIELLPRQIEIIFRPPEIGQ